jgi:hypothetical protein
MTPLPKNLVIMKTVSGIFNADTRLDRTGKNAPEIINKRSIFRIPKVLVVKIMNNAPICNPILNCAFASSPPPPHMGFAEMSGADDVVVALANTCRATRLIRGDDDMRVEVEGQQMKMEELTGGMGTILICSGLVSE